MVKHADFTYLRSPARNEEQFIELTLHSVVVQTVRPIRWVIVSDGSTDATEEIVDKYTAEHHWIELVRMPERRERHFAGKAHAVRAGYGRLAELQFDAVGSLDGDASLEKDYFEFLLRKLEEDPALGLVGTAFKEPLRASYNYRFVGTEHATGICQLFRRKCFEEIGGYVPAKGGAIDRIASIAARMKGWRTMTFSEKMYFHHRRAGTAEHCALMAKFEDGAKDYAVGSHPIWELFRTAYQITNRPFFVGGSALLAGYVWSMVRRVKRPVSPEFVAFHRREQMQRLGGFFTGKSSSRRPQLEASSKSVRL